MEGFAVAVFGMGIRGREYVHLHCGNCQYFILSNANALLQIIVHVLFAKFVGEVVVVVRQSCD